MTIKALETIDKYFSLLSALRFQSLANVNVSALRDFENSIENFKINLERIREKELKKIQDFQTDLVEKVTKITSLDSLVILNYLHERNTTDPGFPYWCVLHDLECVFDYAKAIVIEVTATIDDWIGVQDCEESCGIKFIKSCISRKF